MLAFISILLFFSSFVFTICWTNSYNSAIFSKKGEKAEASFIFRSKKKSLFTTVLALIFVLITQVLTSFYWGFIIASILLIPIIFYVRRSKELKVDIMYDYVYKSGFKNFLIIDIPVHLLYIFIWWSLWYFILFPTS